MSYFENSTEFLCYFLKTPEFGKSPEIRELATALESITTHLSSIPRLSPWLVEVTLDLFSPPEPEPIFMPLILSLFCLLLSHIGETFRKILSLILLLCSLFPLLLSLFRLHFCQLLFAPKPIKLLLSQLKLHFDFPSVQPVKICPQSAFTSGNPSSTSGS